MESPPLRPATAGPATARPVHAIRVAVSLAFVGISLILPASWIEAGFSRGVYPWIQAALVPLFGAMPFPVMGTVVAALPIIIATVAWRRFRRLRRAGMARGRIVAAGSLTVARGALFAYVAFLLLWGLGYRRVPIETRWHLASDPLTTAQVREVQARVLAVLHRDAPSGQPDPERALRAIDAAAADLVAERESFRPRLPAYVKHPPAGALMAIGIFGIVSPFTLEANVEPALPEPFRLAISGHELAHLLGYCGEADANLVGFIAGLRATDSYARYATALGMVRYMVSNRHPKDAQWVLRNLPARARADLAALRGARSRYQVAAFANLTNTVNDRYLRTQGVKLGVRDYSRGFTLFVRAWHRGLVPLPPPFAAPDEK